MSSKIFIIFFTLVLSTASASDPFPCPFNRGDCTCTHDERHPSQEYIFGEVLCESSHFPTFEKPIGQKYQVYNTMTIRSDYVYNMSIFQSAAFSGIGQLKLEQTGSVTRQQWGPSVFETPTDIRWIYIRGLDGMVPLPIAIRRLAERDIPISKLSIGKSNENIHLTKSTFENFTVLNHIEFVDIPIEIIDDDTFSSKINIIVTLSFQNTSLASFPTAIDTYQMKDDLVFLQFTDNKLDKFPRTFRSGEWHRLRGLNLSKNNLGADIENGSMDYLPKSLNSLDLSGNGIKSATKVMISRVSRYNLDELILRDNLIETIKTYDFSFAHLSRIDLSGNPISKIELDSFRYMSQLSILYLNNTSLTSIDFAIFNYLDSKFPRIYFDDNPHLKSIEISEFDSYWFPLYAEISIQRTSLEVIDFSMKQLFDNFQYIKMDVSNNEYLQCKNLTWLSYYVFCTQKVSIVNTTCADQADQPLIDYLRSVESDLCGLSTTEIVTNATTETSSQITTTPKGATSETSSQMTTTPKGTGNRNGIGSLLLIVVAALVVF